MKAPRAWEVLSERELINRQWLRVREQRVRLANGHEIDEFHLVDSPDWAAVVAITDDGQVVLVRQYRHGAAANSLELPAGMIEPGEEGMKGAQRELLEETGYGATGWSLLKVMNTEPARHTTCAHVYVATGAHLVQAPSPEAGEMLEIVLVRATELGRLIDSGEIVHWVHVGAILLAARHGFFSVDG